MARRRNPLLLVSLAILFLGAGTAATLLLRPGGPLAGSSAGTGDPGSSRARVLPVGMANPRPLRPATLSVRVLRDPGGAPVPGARVTVSQAHAVGEALADAGGKAEVGGLVEGQAAVRAEAEGLDGPAAFTTLRPGDNGPVELRLAATVAVAGRVVADEDGAPLAGAAVLLRRDTDTGVGDARFGMVGGRSPLAATTAADGTFSFPAGGAGARVEAHARGFMKSAVPVEEGVAVEVRLLRGARIRGTVRREDGSPVGGAQVFVDGGSWMQTPILIDGGSARVRAGPAIVFPGNLTRRSATTGPDGAYVLEGQPRGAVVQLSARGNGLLPAGGPVEVGVPSDGSDAVVDLVVAEAGSLRVRGTGPDAGGGWYARVVRLPRSPGPEWNQSTRGHPPGGFAFGPMPPGRYEVTLSCSAGTGEAEVVVLPGVTTEVEIGPLLPGDPREGPVLAGEVVDGAGVPVAGARVAVLAAGGTEFRSATLAKISSFTTDAAGRFRLRVAEPGPFWIRATARGFAPGAAGPFTPTTEGIRIPLEAPGAVEGRILLPPGTGASATLALGFHFDPEPGAAAAAVAGEPAHRATTGLRDGRFLLQGLPPGRGSLVGSVDGIPFGPFEVTVRAGEVADVGTLEVAVPRSIRGRVKDGTGAPLAGAFVRVEGELPGLPFASSAQDGSFLLRGVSTGEVRLRAIRSPAPAVPSEAIGGPGLRGRITMLGGVTLGESVPIRIVVTVPAGGDCEIADIILPGPGEVTGHAFDAAGRPATAARVMTAAGDGSFTDARGAFSLRVAAGEHELRLLFPGSTAPSAVATVIVPEGGTVTVDLRAER